MPEPCFSIFVTALITALTLLVEHYAPFVKFITGRERLHPVGNYVIGSLAIFIPFTLLILYWDGLGKPLSPTVTAYALWTLALFGGMTVWGCYKADDIHDTKTRLSETAQRESHLKEALKCGNHESTL